MANAYVRIYKSPQTVGEGSILGFSDRFTEAASDPELHQWLQQRDYRVTPETSEQLATYSHHFGFRTMAAEAMSELGIPIPPETVSKRHLQVEPPLRDEDATALAGHLATLESCDPYH